MLVNELQMTTITQHSFMLLQKVTTSFLNHSPTKGGGLYAERSSSVNSCLKNSGYSFLCLSLTPLRHVHERGGIRDKLEAGRQAEARGTEIRNRMAKTDAVGEG